MAEANRRCNIKGKDFTRTIVGNPSSPMTLSVAIEGGASILKRKGTESRAVISMHGNWPHVHLGAIEAIYGRMPYYQHIMPGLRDILMDLPEKLSGLNRKVHLWLSSFFQSDEAIRIGDSVLLRGDEIKDRLEPELSIIDALMRFGPETNLVLIRNYSETSDYATTCLHTTASVGSSYGESGGLRKSDCAEADTATGSA